MIISLEHTVPNSSGRLGKTLGVSNIRQQTFDRYKLNDPRERGMSQQFSDAITETERLARSTDFNDLLFTEKVRR